MDSNMSTGGKQYHEAVIDALISAKKKEKKAERAVERWGYIFLTILIVGIAYVAMKISTGVAISSYLTFLLSDVFLLLWMALLFLSFHFFNTKSKYFEKKEKDYDELKEDIIDRSADIWYSEELRELRLEKYQELEEKHDINLYHK